jgi:hypothetical protein
MDVVPELVNQFMAGVQHHLESVIFLPPSLPPFDVPSFISSFFPSFLPSIHHGFLGPFLHSFF